MLHVLMGVAAVALIPLYKHVHNLHMAVHEAKAKGIWQQLPKEIPTASACIKLIQNHGEALGMKLKIKGSIVTYQTTNHLRPYELLHRINHIPVVNVKRFDMKRKDKGITGTIEIEFPSCHPEHIAQNPRFRDDKNITFYTPRFHYVNAMTEIDGIKQLWVNGERRNQVPWPLYHTFDSKADKIIKGDHRPKLVILQETS